MTSRVLHSVQIKLPGHKVYHLISPVRLFTSPVFSSLQVLKLVSVNQDVQLRLFILQHLITIQNTGKARHSGTYLIYSSQCKTNLDPKVEPLPFSWHLLLSFRNAQLTFLVTSSQLVLMQPPSFPNTLTYVAARILSLHLAYFLFRGGSSHLGLSSYPSSMRMQSSWGPWQACSVSITTLSKNEYSIYRIYMRAHQSQPTGTVMDLIGVHSQPGPVLQFLACQASCNRSMAPGISVWVQRTYSTFPFQWDSSSVSSQICSDDLNNVHTPCLSNQTLAATVSYVLHWIFPVQYPTEDCSELEFAGQSSVTVARSSSLGENNNKRDDLVFRREEVRLSKQG